MVEKFIKKSAKKIHFYNQMEFRKRSNNKQIDGKEQASYSKLAFFIFHAFRILTS